ncbi:imidazole glycerol phosphate synthase subunit HisH [Thermostilla marina]
MIAIVDYGMGNLRSVQKALEKLGYEAIVTDDPQRVGEASKVILPGVGAFEDAMTNLRRLGMVEPIKAHIAADRPFLGICLGLQLLFDRSYENGNHPGLGVISGEVVRFDLPREYSVPHMGWNEVHYRAPSPIFEGVPDGTFFYFVHSYYVSPSDSNVVAGVTEYGHEFCSMIRRGNLFATQFHPEKSQQLGLAVLKRFAEL